MVILTEIVMLSIGQDSLWSVHNRMSKETQRRTDMAEEEDSLDSRVIFELLRLQILGTHVQILRGR